MKKIRLTNGGVTLVDDVDYEWASATNWQINGWGYVYRSKYRGGYRSEAIYLHKQIVGAEKGQKVDHVDGNRLNNRRSNLRLCEHWQNLFNRAIQKNNTSGYRGVVARRGGWKAQIQVRGKNVHIGDYPTRVEAARAYDRKAIEYAGEFARLNFNREDYNV